MRLTTPINYPLCGVEYEVKKMTQSRHINKPTSHSLDFSSPSEHDPYLVPLIKQRGSINIL